MCALFLRQKASWKHVRTRRLAWTDLISYSFEQSSTTDHQQGYGRVVSNPGSILSRGVANFPYNLTNSKSRNNFFAHLSLNVLWTIPLALMSLFCFTKRPHRTPRNYLTFSWGGHVIQRINCRVEMIVLGSFVRAILVVPSSLSVPTPSLERIHRTFKWTVLRKWPMKWNSVV